MRRRKRADLKPHICVTAQLISDLRSLDYKTFRKRYGFTKVDYKNKANNMCRVLVAPSHNTEVNQEYKFM